MGSSPPEPTRQTGISSARRRESEAARLCVLRTMPLLLPLGTTIWFGGWLLDVGSTVRGIRRAGTVRWELNPIARRLIARFGVPAGFAMLGLVEASIVAVYWALALAAPRSLPGAASVVGCALCVAFAGVCHALAGYGNLTGRVVAPLRPIARFCRWIDRRWKGTPPRDGGL